MIKAFVHLSPCLSPCSGVPASHYIKILANPQYFLTARRFRLDCAFPFRFYLHLISHYLLHALRLGAGVVVTIAEISLLCYLFQLLRLR